MTSHYTALQIIGGMLLSLVIGIVFAMVAYVGTK